MVRTWRAHHPEAGRAAEGTELSLERGDSHHVVRVLRLREGDELGVFDGEGAERRATLVSADRQRARVRLGAALDDPVEPPVEVTLYQGRCRADRMDLVVQKATELGVAAVVAVDLRRSEGPPADPRRLERWRRIALEACKQCGRRRVPRVAHAPGLPPPAAGTTALLLDPAPGAAPLGGAALGDGPVWLAVGPESGLDEAERREALARGWRPVGLGPRVLRTETAGLAAAAIVLCRRGDLGAAGAGELAPAPPRP